MRLEWIDVGKGTCIILVVLGHTVLWYANNFESTTEETWSYLLLGLRPLRMPLFFMISGILAARTLGRPLREIWSKTGGLYVLYCLWTAINFLKLALPGGRDGLPYPDAGQIVGAFLLPVTLWYIWALPVFYMLAWLLERCFGARSRYALVPMIGLSLASSWIGRNTDDLLGTPLLMVQSQSVTANLLWFYVGVKARAQIIAIAGTSTLARLVVASCLAVLTIWLSRHLEDARLLIVMTPVVLWAALEWLGHVRRGSVWTAPLAAVGRNTLPVYVLHIFVLSGLTFVLRALKLDSVLPFASPPLQIVGPLVIAALLIPGCVIAGRVLAAMRLGFLAEPFPSPFGTQKAARAG